MTCGKLGSTPIVTTFVLLETLSTATTAWLSIFFSDCNGVLAVNIS